MTRGRYKYYAQTDFRGGINQEPENAQPNQLVDARNVWAPEGRLVQRPGYVGEVSMPGVDGTSQTNAVLVSEDVSTAVLASGNSIPWLMAFRSR